MLASKNPTSCTKNCHCIFVCQWRISFQAYSILFYADLLGRYVIGARGRSSAEAAAEARRVGNTKKWLDRMSHGYKTLFINANNITLAHHVRSGIHPDRWLSHFFGQEPTVIPCRIKKGSNNKVSVFLQPLCTYVLKCSMDWFPVATGKFVTWKMASDIIRRVFWFLLQCNFNPFFWWYHI